MTTQRTATPVTITLTNATPGKVTATITHDGEIIATRTTKDGGRFIQRLDDFLSTISVHREGYHVEDGVMVASGYQF